MAGTFSTISLISFIAAGVFFVLAVVFWIVFHIPSVIGDLSGRNAKKNLNAIRLNNEKTGNKAYRPSKTNLERGKITSPIEPDVGVNEYQNVQTDMVGTGVLNERPLPTTESSEAETTMLNAVTTTEPLSAEDAENETTVLASDVNAYENRTNAHSISIIDEEMIVHTNEEAL